VFPHSNKNRPIKIINKDFKDYGHREYGGKQNKQTAATDLATMSGKNLARLPSKASLPASFAAAREG
jgi:hypothetical protein